MREVGIYTQTCFQCSFNNDLTQCANRNIEHIWMWKAKLELYRPAVKTYRHVLHSPPKIIKGKPRWCSCNTLPWQVLSSTSPKKKKKKILCVVSWGRQLAKKQKAKVNQGTSNSFTWGQHLTVKWTLSTNKYHINIMHPLCIHKQKSRGSESLI